MSDYGQTIRSTVLKHVGVPVCVGIAPTKTLAKLANYSAKKFKATHGVVDLREPERQKRLMEITPVSEIWGVGRKLTESLKRRGVETALQLSQMDPHQVRRLYSVVLERTVCELSGESCLGFEETTSAKQQIVCSRSFGDKLTQYTDLREAVCEFAPRAAEKLRGENRLALVVNVFIRTSPFDNTGPHYSNAATGKLLTPSSDTLNILGLVLRLFEMIWQGGYRYAKARVMLSDFCSPDHVQFNLFDSQAVKPKNDTLMQAIDANIPVLRNIYPNAVPRREQSKRPAVPSTSTGRYETVHYGLVQSRSLLWPKET